MLMKLGQNKSQPNLKAIVEYRKHSSITVFQTFPNKYLTFSIIENKYIFGFFCRITLHIF